MNGFYTGAPLCQTQLFQPAEINLLQWNVQLSPSPKMMVPLWKHTQERAKKPYKVREGGGFPGDRAEIFPHNPQRTYTGAGGYSRQEL